MIHAADLRQTSRNQIRSWFSHCILQGTSDDKGRALSEEQAEDSAIEFPKAVLEGVFVPSAMSSCRMRKNAIDDEGVEANDDNGDDEGDDQSGANGDALVFSIRILEGVVLESEVLVKRPGES